MPRPPVPLPLLLLAGTVAACHDPQLAIDHAQAVAARILPTYAAGLRPGSLTTYHVFRSELNSYLEGDRTMPAGYLVTYVCDIPNPRPHVETFAAFVDEADALTEFVPDRNLDRFAYRYGVDYRPYQAGPAQMRAEMARP